MRTILYICSFCVMLLFARTSCSVALYRRPVSILGGSLNSPVGGRGEDLLQVFARMPPRKRKSSVDEDEMAQEKPATRKRVAKVKEPYTDDDGKGDVSPNAKLACFDLDNTIIKQKSTATIPRNADDWKFYNKDVPNKLKEFAADGFKIVIFTNQNSIKSALEGKAAEKAKGRINNMIKEVGLPMQVFIAPAKDEMRKPEKGMWDFFLENCNGDVTPDMETSFFVGDAAGRAGDFAASDKEFAEKIGIPFKVPEDIFGEQEGKSRVVVEASEDNKNEGITSMFDALAQDATVNGGDRGHFKAGAYRKVSKVIKSFPNKIEKGNLKDVGKLPGVGKASLEKIKEFIETGTCEAFKAIGKDKAGGEESAAGADKPDSKSAGAMKFL